MKAKAPVWLTESFRDGVDERESVRVERSGKPYPDAWTACWLAAHDPLRRPCGGQNLGVVANIERAHMISRQRVENAMWALLPRESTGTTLTAGGGITPILLAAWDCRGAVWGCEHHHRRFDSHATPALTVPVAALPDHVVEFAFDYGLEHLLEKFG